MSSAPTPLSSDSTGALSVAQDPVKDELTKHIGVDASYMRLQVHDQIVALHYVPSEFQLADFFTKAQTRAQHSYFLSKLSVVDPHKFEGWGCVLDIYSCVYFSNIFLLVGGIPAYCTHVHLALWAVE